MKKKLYFFQVNYPYGNSAHLPYTAGHLVAYAMQDKDIKESFTLEDIFFLRDAPEKIMNKIDSPAVVAFSTYLWNCNFNKAMAEMIKKKYPSCVIVFGGHHVAPGGKMLEECPYIDYLLHGEGEIIFRRLLRAVLGLEEFTDIPGISMRTDGGVLTNPEMISSECNFPSPYLEGYFDKILRENPHKEFMGLIETSRGCPNSCAYCDWSNMKSKIRKFPLERIYKEIEWMRDNKICVLGSADSNFGMFSRDMEITKRLVEAKKEGGYPMRFQTSYAKNSPKRVFDIGMLLEKEDMNRGITLSFQSMSKEVQKNIGRENISIEYYSQLMALYNEAGVATYTELILGLPGETYESIVDGIDELLNLGQHNSIYIHNCEWLPCSIMGKPDYIEQFRIKTSKIPLNQPHREPSDDDIIPETSSIVTSTCSMDTDSWKKMNMFSYAVQAFHHMGILLFFALYLYNEKICSYKQFYTGLLDFFLKNPQTVAGKAFRTIENYLDAVLQENGTLSCCDERFGKVQWPFEEYAYLHTVYDIDLFYKEAESYLREYNIPTEIFSSLMSFQRKMMKTPFDNSESIQSGYNFYEYFSAFLSSAPIKLQEKREAVSVDVRSYGDWADFARKIAWYGRKNGATTYLKDVKALNNDKI